MAPVKPTSPAELSPQPGRRSFTQSGGPAAPMAEAVPPPPQTAPLAVPPGSQIDVAHLRHDAAAQQYQPSQPSRMPPSLLPPEQGGPPGSQPTLKLPDALPQGDAPADQPPQKGVPDTPPTSKSSSSAKQKRSP